ncbi:hypothetical protein [Psychrilyobacter atlanticus]|uniref:hypothetical protein n=1 Tax=Psychrilyobacter atlanticus TaxID=271091 RepID=UPI00040685D0|nr:hypothetical protein [Psychrilyobacter atlanticus]
MKKIFLILVGLILLGCSSADKTSTNTDYDPWYNDYYYGYYDDYYDNDVSWDDLSDEEKKEIIEGIKENPEFQEYVKDKLEDRFPDGIPQVEDRERTKEDILNNRDELNKNSIKERPRPPVSKDNLILKDRIRQPRTRNLKR